MTFATSARADGDANAAEALFEAGREAIERGDFATACPKFAESDRLDPAAGTRINLADCEERVGHPAAAWRHWREALELLPSSDPRAPLVRERAAQVDKHVPRLTLKLGSSAPGMRIERDGIEVGVASLQVPLPVEPGEHTVSVTAPGRGPVEVRFSLGDGERKFVTVDVGPRLEAPPAGDTAAPSRPFPFRTVGFVALAVGGASIAVGSAFGVVALNAKSVVAQNCNPPTQCNDRGASAAARGHAFATASTITVTAGAVLGVAGLALVLTHPAKAAPALALGLEPGGVSFEGSF